MERDTRIKEAWAKAFPVFYETQASGKLPAIVSVFTARHVGTLVGQYQHRLLGSPDRPAAFIRRGQRLPVPVFNSEAVAQWLWLTTSMLWPSGSSTKTP